MENTEFVVGMELNEDIYSSRGILLLRKGVTINANHIQLLARHSIKVATNKEENREHEFDEGFQLYKEVLTDLKEEYIRIQDNQYLSNAAVRSMIDSFSRVFHETDLNVIELKEKIVQGEYLFEHGFNVGIIASKIGKDLKLAKDDQLLLGQMGLFYDIGKFQVAPRILNKPASLTAAEFDVIKKHPVQGYNLLKHTDVGEEILLAATMHHERLDGSGYPNGLKANNIPLPVRILSIADSFDAICSERAYKGTQSIFFAVEELLLEARQNKLDLDITNSFTYHLMEGLKGKVIRLRNGKIASINHVFQDSPNQPVLTIEGYSPLNLKEVGLSLIQVAKI